MPSKVWERTKVVFAPTGRIPSFRRLAPWPFLWLGCWSVSCTPSLDTHINIPNFGEMRSLKLFDHGLARRLLLEPKERRESGEDKREFEELLKRDLVGVGPGEENDERGNH